MQKSDFIKIMKELKSLLEAGRRVDKAMKELSPDFGGFYNERAETLIVEAIKFAMKDESDWIKHYLYELEWGKKYKDGCITDNGKNIKLKTLSDLYKLLTP